MCGDTIGQSIELTEMTEEVAVSHINTARPKTEL